jgi:hypothetical protein
MTSRTHVIVPLSAKEGTLRFERAAFKKNLFALIQNYQPQLNPCSCGLACAVIVLNCLRSSGESFRQLDLLNAKTDRIKPRRFLTPEAKGLAQAGLTLDELAKILRVFSLNVTVLPAKDGAEAFRRDLKRVLKAPNQFLVSNFLFSRLFGEGGGHFVPVGAYDEKSDSALLVEVANHRRLWYWAPTEWIYEAMNVIDPDSGRPRGYLIINKRNRGPVRLKRT